MIRSALTKSKATIKVIAPEQGVVHGWQGDAWGHYFPVDAQIGEVLGSDFDILILPGGERGALKRLRGKALDGIAVKAGDLGGEGAGHPVS